MGVKDGKQKAGRGTTWDLHVRAPDFMRDVIHARAEKVGRSVNAEIVALIVAGLGYDDIGDMRRNVAPVTLRRHPRGR